MNVIFFIMYNILVSVDQLINTLLLGHPDETISSRLGRTKGKERYIWVKWLRLLVDYMFFWDYKINPDTNTKLRHCELSVMPQETLHFRGYNRELWQWTKES